jgi:hypothetical protein
MQRVRKLVVEGSFPPSIRRIQFLKGNHHRPLWGILSGSRHQG